MRPGDRLSLIREPENTYDQNAVAVKHDGHHLGYVPARHHWVAEAIDEEHKLLSCGVTRIEEEGWFFRRASFVGIQISINDDEGVADTPEAAVLAAHTAEQSRRIKKARELCIDGLRVLAYMAMADDVVTSEEVNIEASYIETAGLGWRRSRCGTDRRDARSVPRACRDNARAFACGQYRCSRSRTFKLVLDAVLQLASMGGDPKGVQTVALERLSNAGKVKGWI